MTTLVCNLTLTLGIWRCVRSWHTLGSWTTIVWNIIQIGRMVTKLWPGHDVVHVHFWSSPDPWDPQGGLCKKKILSMCLRGLIIPSQQLGGDIVNWLFVGGWVSEWVCGFVGACVRGSVTLYLVDTIATTVFDQSLSNFTYKLWIMREGTLLILGHGVKGQGQLWHSVYKTLWTQ